ncbi:MAG: DUF2975 domain-containing protein [Polaribacter sp.]|nr:DUF2975 domain-containing protein [Polaribacter sp.]
MKKTNTFVFIIVKIVAWLIFVGLCIEAGALIVNFVYSIFKPEIVGKLYQKLDLQEMYQLSKWVFFRMFSFVLVVSLLKAYLFYLVILLVTKFDLSKPFNEFVSEKISQISYFTFSIGFVSYIARQAGKNITNKGIDTQMLNQFWVDSQAFILMSAVIYIIAIIFKKGIELQHENDLTV